MQESTGQPAGSYSDTSKFLQDIITVPVITHATMRQEHLHSTFPHFSHRIAKEQKIAEVQTSTSM